MNVIDIIDGGYGIINFLNEDKPAIIDTGFAFTGPTIEKQVKEILGDKPLEYILLTHSHYDHVGSVSYLRKAFPGVKVLASAKTAKVFTSEGAKAFMRKMEEDASRYFKGFETTEYDTSGFYVDQIIGEGDIIDLGSSKLEVLETKGHTDCAISFYNKEDSILFASESTGVLFNSQFPISLELCKSYKDAVASIKKCRKLFCKTVYLPHFGKLTRLAPEEYFAAALAQTVFCKDVVYEAYKEGLSDEEVFKRYVEETYDVMIENKIGMDSFERWAVNARNFIASVKRDYNL
ncbi:MAG: MBL fold metallo-hydrolase [Clostridia bacterium]|nr:MBL fold metallo-hydrolase [Clostridia bacterium]